MRQDLVREELDVGGAEHPGEPELDHLEAKRTKFDQPIAQLGRVTRERRLLPLDGITRPAQRGGPVPPEIDRQRGRLVDRREVTTGSAAVIGEDLDLAGEDVRSMAIGEPPIGLARGTGRGSQ